MKNYFFISLFLFGFVPFLFGQQYDDIIDSDTVYTDLDEIIVSANRWEQNLREVANRVTTVNAKLVELQNPQTAADLLSLSNSVFVQKSQLGGGSPMIRGFATNRVLLVVDGVRMNNAIFRSGNVQNVISLDPNAIESAEVVFGPGSVMYGSDAIGGVMDFHTLRPKFSQDKSFQVTANALARYSSANNERTWHGDVNLFGKRWSVLSSVTRSEFDDLRMGSKGPSAYTRPDYVIRENGEDVVVVNDDPNLQKFSGYDQWNFTNKLSLKVSPDFTIDYAWHFSETSDYARYDRLILREEGALSSAEWYYGPQRWNMHALTFHYNAPTILFDQVKLISALQDYEESRHNRGFGGSNLTHRTENVEAFSINLDLDKRLTDQLTIFYGGEWIDNTVSSKATRENINSRAIIPWSTRYPDGATWRSAAAYAHLKYKPFDQWTFNISGRFTSVTTEAEFDLTFFDFPFTNAKLNNKNVNGSVGAIYSPNERVKVYANGSTGFRAPNVDDIGKVFDSSQGSVVVPNPSLEPEKAISAEIGVAAVLWKKLKVDGALYYSIISNAIIRGPYLFNGQEYIDYDGVESRVYAQQNISELNVKGFQVGVNWEFVKGISLTSSFNYQRGKEFDPETMHNYSPTHVAPNFGATHLVMNKKHFTLDLYANYNGKISFNRLALTERADAHLYAKDKNGNPYSPRWTTLNLKTQWNVHRNISLNASVENVLNKRYRPYSSGISAPGRNFILALRTTI